MSEKFCSSRQALVRKPLNERANPGWNSHVPSRVLAHIILDRGNSENKVQMSTVGRFDSISVVHCCLLDPRLFSFARK